MVRKVMLETIAKHEIFIIMGILMAGGTAAKLFLGYDFSSDWFWLIAGLGLIVEGSIALSKQRKFDKKFKIVERGESG